MKIILEKSDVLFILGKHFKTEMKEENVVFKPDTGFEIQITGVAVTGGDEEEAPAPTAPPKTPVKRTASADEIAQALEENGRLPRADRNTLSAVPSDFSEEI